MIASGDHPTRLAAGERIASLDVIRGVAILFILFMNILAMASYFPSLRDIRLVSWTPVDQAVAVVHWGFLNGTQRGLLELLFGAGIIIMARKAMSPEGPVAVADLHYRRNLLLILFGLFNALVLLWPWDILLPYGIAAIFLFPCRLLRPRWLIGLAALFLCLAQAGGVHGYFERRAMQQAAAEVAVAAAEGRVADPRTKELAEEWNEAVEAAKPLAESPKKQRKLQELRENRLGPLPAYARARWGEWVKYFEPMEFFPSLAEIVGTMLLGMALFKLGIMQGSAGTRTYWALLAAGYAIGISMRYVGLQEVFRFSAEPRLYLWFGEFARIALTLGHLAALHLMLRVPLGQRLLAPFQAAGRIPLTTYLFTSFLTMWVLFPGFGLGLHGRWGLSGMVAVAALIIAFEVVLTNLWMRRHETGPMEWLWKSLAYGRRQPYRRAPASAPLAVPAE